MRCCKASTSTINVDGTITDCIVEVLSVQEPEAENDSDEEAEEAMVRPSPTQVSDALTVTSPLSSLMED